MVILEQAGFDEEELLVVFGLIYTYIFTMALSPIHDHACRLMHYMQHLVSFAVLRPWALATWLTVISACIASDMERR